MKKLKKIVKLKVFDFDTHLCAYALKSKKNIFGYKYQNEYYWGGRLVYKSPQYDNVEDQSFYWLAFGINRQQLTSLQHRVDPLIDDDIEILSLLDTSLDVRFSDGSALQYQGDYTRELFQKVLKR